MNRFGMVMSERLILHQKSFQEIPHIKMSWVTIDNK